MAQALITHDYYAILGVPQTADAALIRGNYLRLAKLKHPDRNITDRESTSQFQLLEAAYSTLRDPAQRQAYDRDHYSRIQPGRYQAGARPGSSGTNNGTADKPVAADPSNEQEDLIHQLDLRHQHLVRLHKSLAQNMENLTSDLSTANRDLAATHSCIRRLREEAAADLADEAALNTRGNRVLSRMDLSGRRKAATAQVREDYGRRATEREARLSALEATRVREAREVNRLEVQVDRAEVLLAENQAAQRAVVEKMRRMQVRGTANAPDPMRAAGGSGSGGGLASMFGTPNSPSTWGTEQGGWNSWISAGVAGVAVAATAAIWLARGAGAPTGAGGRGRRGNTPDDYPGYS